MANSWINYFKMQADSELVAGQNMGHHGAPNLVGSGLGMIHRKFLQFRISQLVCSLFLVNKNEKFSLPASSRIAEIQ